MFVVRRRLLLFAGYVGWNASHVCGRLRFLPSTHYSNASLSTITYFFKNLINLFFIGFLIAFLQEPVEKGRANNLDFFTKKRAEFQQT